MIRLAVVTDNVDPDQLRRVRVTSSDRGIGQSTWIPRVTGFGDEDLPVPSIGTTVIIANLEEGSTDEVVLGVLQTGRSNVPIKEKRSDLGSWFSTIMGKFHLFCSGTFQINSDQRITLNCGESVITLDPSGEISIGNPRGKLVLGVDGDLSHNWIGSTLNRFAKIGGTDTDSDITLS
jgi:hypothetical protein